MLSFQVKRSTVTVSDAQVRSILEQLPDSPLAMAVEFRGERMRWPACVKAGALRRAIQYWWSSEPGGICAPATSERTPDMITAARFAGLPTSDPVFSVVIAGPWAPITNIGLSDAFVDTIVRRSGECEFVREVRYCIADDDDIVIDNVNVTEALARRALHYWQSPAGCPTPYQDACLHRAAKIIGVPLPRGG